MVLLAQNTVKPKFMKQTHFKVGWVKVAFRLGSFDDVAPIYFEDWLKSGKGGFEQKLLPILRIST